MTQAVTTHTSAETSRARDASIDQAASQEIIQHAFAPATTPAAAEAFTRELTHSHYENFSVVSILLPKHLRQDFCNVYAFCRTSDDLADELSDRNQALSLLGRFRQQLHACYEGRTESAVYLALSQTIQRHSIPIQPFDDLLDAFDQDQRMNRYQTFAELCDYCRRSADPVGRLVLYMCGYRDAQRQTLSDKTCTALQLANFWQDIRRDLLDRNRIYLPIESMQQFGIDEIQLRQHIEQATCDDVCRRLIKFEVDRTAALFAEGDALLPLLDRSVRGQVGLFGAGGKAVLNAIRARNYDTLTNRPSLSKSQKGRLICSALLGRIAGMFSSPANASGAAVEARA